MDEEKIQTVINMVNQTYNDLWYVNQRMWQNENRLCMLESQVYASGDRSRIEDYDRRISSLEWKVERLINYIEEGIDTKS